MATDDDWLTHDEEDDLASYFEDKSALEAEIAAIRAGLIQVATTGQTYSTDTGQMRVSVTRANMTEMKNRLNEARAELSDLKAKARGGRDFIARPGF